MRRSQAARLVDPGLHPDTLLVLERRGLISPDRDWNGHRRYNAEHIEQLRRLVFPVRGAKREADGPSAA